MIITTISVATVFSISYIFQVNIDYSISSTTWQTLYLITYFTIGIGTTLAFYRTEKKYWSNIKKLISDALPPSLMLMIWTGIIILIFYGISNLILEDEDRVTSFFSRIGIILLIYWVFPNKAFHEKPSIYTLLGKPRNPDEIPSKLWISIASAIRLNPNTFDFYSEGSLKNWDLSTLIFLIEIFILIPILVFRLLLFLPIQYQILIHIVGFVKWAVNTHNKVNEIM